MITKRSNHIPMFTTIEMIKENIILVRNFLNHINWGENTLHVIMAQYAHQAYTVCFKKSNGQKGNLGVVSPGILAVFLMGLFYKKATNNAAIWGVILSIPIAMYFKVAPNGWSDAAMFVNIPFMHQMMLTCIGTILVIAGISKLEGNQDDPKGIVLSKQLFATDKTFNVAAFGVLLITVLLYALFW